MHIGYIFFFYFINLVNLVFCLHASLHRIPAVLVSFLLTIIWASQVLFVQANLFFSSCLIRFNLFSLGVITLVCGGSAFVIGK